MIQQPETNVERLARSKGPCDSCYEGFVSALKQDYNKGEKHLYCRGTGEVYLYLGKLLEECHADDSPTVQWGGHNEDCCHATGYRVTTTEEKLWEVVIELDAPEYTKFLRVIIAGRDIEVWLGHWMKVTPAERREALSAAILGAEAG